MIHLTVSSPMGIDSVFFSFIQRLAEQNGHHCVDAPLHEDINREPLRWIQDQKKNDKHQFVMGYRYPPSYWKQLASTATTVCLVSDPYGIVRQIAQIKLINMENEDTSDLRSSIADIKDALELTIDMAQWILSRPNSDNLLFPPAISFAKQPHMAFARLERFYQQCGVSLETSCFDAFSHEASHLLESLPPVQEHLHDELYRLLTLEASTPARLATIKALFGYSRSYEQKH